MKRVAVIGDAVSPDFFFPLWHRYYGALFGPENLHLVTYQGLAGAFSAFALGNLWCVNAPYDDGLRCGVISDLVAVLLRSHDAVIRCDMDEFLLPDPERFADLADFVARNELPYVTAQGIDAVELPEDAPLDLDRPIFGLQRHYGIRAAALNKTCVTTIPLRWAEGFHGASVPPRFAGLYNLHLKFADLKKRIAWDETVARGLVPGTAEHTYFTVGAAHLAGVQQHLASRPKGGAETQSQFDARYLETVHCNPENGIYQGAFLTQDFLTPLAGFAPRPPPAPVPALQLAIKSFESIGHNCEFGFVAAALGGDDSGLFRWAYVHNIGQVIAALNARFAGLFADPGRLVTCFGEMIEDPEFGLAFHTGIKTYTSPSGWQITRDAEFPALYAKEAEKIRYLADKFLQSLQRGGKFFVYKENDGVADDDAQRLHDAILRHGANGLLVVDVATPEHPAGTVVKLRDGLFRGFITRFSPYTNVEDIEITGWRLMLETVTQVAAGKRPDRMFDGRAVYLPREETGGSAPPPGQVDDMLRAYENAAMTDPPPEAGLLKTLEAPSQIARRAPDFVADLSGYGLTLPIPDMQNIRGSFLVQRRDALLFGPNNLITPEGDWSCEARAGKPGFIDFYTAPFYDAVFPGPKPKIQRQPDGLRLDLSALAAPDVTIIAEPVFLATPLEPGIFGRWITCLPPKIAAYQQHGAGRKFLCHAAHEWEKSFLQLWGVPQEMILPHDPGRTYLLHDAMALEFSAADLSISAAERNHFLEFVIRHRARPAHGEKIFVSRITRSRAHAHYRVLQNEVELAAGLERMGFASFEPEFFPLDVQAATFAAAQQVVFLGGSAIFNAVFCAPDASVISIESGNVFAGTHSALLSQLGLRHGVIFGREDMTDTTGGHKRWALDLERALPLISDFFRV